MTEIKPDGTDWQYSTYLGGSVGDQANGIAVDSAGNVLVTGSTTSQDDFPTMNPLQPRNRGSTNAFVTKLNPSVGLVYSTYLGGSLDGSHSGANAIAVDGSGDAYVTGSTSSSDFPIYPIPPNTPSPFQPSNGSGPLFKGTANGINWVTANRGLPNTVTAVAVNPTNSSIMYAGTVDGNIFVSTDGGTTWTSSNSTPGSSVTSLVVDSTNPATVYASVHGINRGDDVYRSTNSGQTWAPYDTNLPPNSVDTLFFDATSGALYAGPRAGSPNPQGFT